MTKSKDKQIRELKESKGDWKSTAIMFVIFFLILSLAIIFSPKINNLESQLKSCQEKVPVWTLKVECNDEEERGLINQVITITNYNYEDYKESIMVFNEMENCEVLE